MNKAPEIGHEPIDNHHSELFDLTVLLDEALFEQSIAKVEEIIVFLEDYVVDHFNEEEQLMKNHQFAHYQYHKEEHDIFKSKVLVLRQRFNRKASLTHMVFFIRILLDDLINHINIVDITMAELTKGNTNE